VGAAARVQEMAAASAQLQEMAVASAQLQEKAAAAESAPGEGRCGCPLQGVAAVACSTAGDDRRLTAQPAALQQRRTNCTWPRCGCQVLRLPCWLLLQPSMCSNELLRGAGCGCIQLHLAHHHIQSCNAPALIHLHLHSQCSAEPVLASTTRTDPFVHAVTLPHPVELQVPGLLQLRRLRQPSRWLDALHMVELECSGPGRSL